MAKGDEKLFDVSSAEDRHKYGHYSESREGDDEDGFPEQNPGHFLYSIFWAPWEIRRPDKWFGDQVRMVEEFGFNCEGAPFRFVGCDREKGGTG